MNLSNFGNRELLLTSQILKLYADGDLTRLAFDFFGSLQSVEFNSSSGYVYLVDEDYNCLAFNPEVEELDLWITLPFGSEGFLNDLIAEADKLCEEDQDSLSNYLDYMSPEQILEFNSRCWCVYIMD